MYIEGTVSLHNKSRAAFYIKHSFKEEKHIQMHTNKSLIFFRNHIPSRVKEQQTYRTELEFLRFMMYPFKRRHIKISPWAEEENVIEREKQNMNYMLDKVLGQ